MIINPPSNIIGICNGDIGVVVHICGPDEFEIEGVGDNGECKWHDVIHRKYINKISPKCA
jgi:hypothetical protein